MNVVVSKVKLSGHESLNIFNTETINATEVGGRLKLFSFILEAHLAALMQ